MKIRTKILLPVALFLVVTAATGVFFIVRSLNAISRDQTTSIMGINDDTLQQVVDREIEVLQASIDAVGREALNQAALFAQHEAVIAAYRVALSGNIADEESAQSQRARDMLREEFRPIIAGFVANTESSDLRLHFHLPNARSLVRLWRDGWQTTRDGVRLDVSDDISPFRRTVTTINREPHRSITGIEIGRGGFVIRGLSAVTAPDGEHLGSNEILRPFLSALEALPQDGDLSVFIYMDANQLPVARALQDPERYPVLEQRYVRTDAIGEASIIELITADFLDRGRAERAFQRRENLAMASFPIQDFSDETVGVAVLAIDTTDTDAAIATVDERFNTLIIFLAYAIVVGLAVVIVVVIAMLVLTTRIFFRPINIAGAALADIASGEGDLTREIAIHSDDEAGFLSEAFNTFIGKLKKIVQKIQDAATRNMEIKDRLDDSSTEIATAIHEITDTTTSMGSQVDTLNENVDSSIREIARIVENIASLRDTVEAQTTSVAQSTSAIEQMVASIRSMEGIARAKKESMVQLTRATKVGGEKLEDTLTVAGEINDSIDDILELVTLINNVAAQTNLLSMNAAIEAAHAGDAGKGFAVVADEIRKLAEDSRASAENISAILNGVVERVQNIYQSSRATRDAFDAVDSNVSQFTQAFEEIHANASELTLGCDEVLRAVTSLSTISEEVKDGTRTMEESSGVVHSSIGRVRDISAVVSHGVGEIDTGTRDITRSIELVAEQVGTLGDTAGLLSSEVARFKTTAD